jgi:hypothetical protein
LLRGWKTSPKTVNYNIIYQFHFLLLTSAQTELFRVIVSFTKFGAVARTYPVACSGCASATLIFATQPEIEKEKEIKYFEK